jgi:hypothetical protein
MRPAAAVGTQISWWKEIFITASAMRSLQVVPLRYASPESGCLCCHLTS